MSNREYQPKSKNSATETAEKAGGDVSQSAVAALLNEQISLKLWERAVYLFIGAGKRGKTATARYVLETARENGCDMIAIDLEQVGKGLRASHPECLRPGYEINNGADLAEYLYPAIIQGVEQTGYVLVDTQGNDERLISLVNESDLLDVLHHSQIRLVIVATTGGGSDDLAVLEKLVAAFKGSLPDAFVPIFAERLMPSHRKAKSDAMEQLLEVDGLAAWVAASTCHVVSMPTCDLINYLDHIEISFRKAALSTSAPDQTNPLAYFQRSSVKRWLEKLDFLFENVVPAK